MRPPSLFLSLLILPLGLVSPNRLDDPPALPEGTVAKIGSEEISLEQYKQYLFELAGFKHLENFVYERLLKEEAQQLGIVVTEAELDASWIKELDSLKASFQGDEATLLKALEETGYGIEGSKRRFLAITLPQTLEKHIILATRQVKQPTIVEYFNRNYGEGGVKVILRHLMLTRSRMKSDLAKRNIPIADLTNDRLDTEIQGKALALLAELQAGADFETVARRESADLSVNQNGGLIPKYNYRHYGEELAKAVRAAEVGVVLGPVQTQSGVHLFLVEERTSVTLEQVRAEIVAALMVAPANFTEITELKQRLMAKHEIQWPR